MYTAPRLMELAENKYKSRVEKIIWGALSVKQEEIMVMKVQMEKALSSKSKPTMKGKSTSANDKAQRKKAEDQRKHVKQKDVDPKTQEIQGKMWHWCPHHGEEGMWTIHSPEQCRNNLRNKEVKANATEFPMGMSLYSN